MEDTRIIRDLLDANLRLTEQVCEMARLAIGAPVVHATARAPMAPVEQSAPQDFAITSADDWDDIPADMDEQIAAAFTEHIAENQPDVRNLQLVAPIEPRDLPGYMSEEEEDLRWQVAMGQEAPARLSEMLNKLAAPSSEIEMSLV